MADHLALLREVINRRAIIFAQTYHLPHFLSKGGTVFFEPYIDKSGNTRHGNFCDASYNMIYKNPTWAGCLKKTLVHRNSLPLYKQSVASELDSSSSSSALLMNIFCYPDIFSSARLFSMFGIDGLTAVFNKHVPLQKKDGFHESVNIDMIMGDNRYISAALTQSGFSERRKEDMYLYSSFDDIFDSDALPQTSASFLGSNVLRSIMAASSTGSQFFLICDARRPDMIKLYQKIVGAIVDQDIRYSVHLLLWQEMAGFLPSPLVAFLREKYSIRKEDY